MQALLAADRDFFSRIINSASPGVPATSSDPSISMICPREHLNCRVFLLAGGTWEFSSKPGGNMVAACDISIFARAVWLEQLEKSSLK